jgi:hypothetical protein
MSDPRRRWFVDIWDEDNDPAVRRLREAMAPRPIDAPRSPDKAEVAPPPSPEPKRALRNPRRGVGESPIWSGASGPAQPTPPWIKS